VTDRASAVIALTDRLGRAMTRPGATADEVASVPDVGVGEVEVTARWGTDEPDHAEIVLAAGLALAELEELLGPARAVPRAPHGPPGVVFDAADGWTVLATLDRGGEVRSVMVRRDG
jgi:hypothetical protein